jgi:DNA-binding LacI/PurR family transcriptional regulator
MKTQEEIARKLNISQKTVSRVLNGSPLVKEATREKVLHEIENSGYSLNLNARNLTLNKCGAVGILAPVDNTIESIYFTKGLQGISESLRGASDNMLLINAENKEDAFQKLRMEINRVDGMIVFNLNSVWSYIDGIVDFLEKSSKKYAIINYTDKSKKSGIFISIDNVKGGMDATSYLMSLGHKKIAFLGKDKRWTEIEARYQGYCKALKNAGLPLNNKWILGANVDNMANELKAVFSSGDAPTAIFARSDKYARLAIYELKAMGLKVPEDISIIGFDDSNFAIMSAPQISTLRQPVYEAGKAAVEFISQNDPKGGNIVLNPSLIERDSCKKY